MDNKNINCCSIFFNFLIAKSILYTPRRAAKLKMCSIRFGDGNDISILEIKNVFYTLKFQEACLQNRELAPFKEKVS